ncbi:uncharacterized protein A4U43_C05F19470 [Asparagus officinalis]|uniref:Carotenoid 9,10(9',10')-cleavage dioxygenase 1-like n=1 Tax=Asparagus officinalis TaxID=4686 RepID=A0A5P1EX69_ASPOF|nr:carotenoid 9,10(9',10')-cleavage dioxygenase-like [Asparagus officinalis]ONK69111.1 uncharacterized protein A4U43_C05F19470 [Asparagus officinalis]
MTSISRALCSDGFFTRPPGVHSIQQLTSSLISSKFQPLLRELKQVSLRLDISKGIKNASQRLLDLLVDSTFKFTAQPLLPSQRNFAPVDEIGPCWVRIDADRIEGEVPSDFPEGFYIRNGSNPLFGALQSTESVFGRSSETWVEGEGMLHAIRFARDADSGKWKVSYKNRYIQSDTFRIEKEKNKPCFLPAIEGDSAAILAAYFLNQLRFGKINKYISNTNVFEHSGKIYSIAENHIPQEVDIFSLETLGNWDRNGEWGRPFIAHPKKAPGSGELVIVGADAVKPYLVLGILSADGRTLKHKVDLKLERSIVCHDIGVTNMYNIILDFPITVDINRLIQGGPLMKYDKESYGRIGVMPRYGDADSVKWFEVERCCVFHIINCFENGDEVVVRGFRSLESIIPGPDHGHDKFQWFSEGFKPISKNKESSSEGLNKGLFFSRVYEWRLNMKTGNAMERYLTGCEFALEFPMMNDSFSGQHNKYGYAQVVDSIASSICAKLKYRGLAKFYFEEQSNGISEVEAEKSTDGGIKVEHHHLGDNKFCSGGTFISKRGSQEEDDGWIVVFVHDEDLNSSQVHIIDTKRFGSDPVVKITLPQRVPYGFHGTFIPRRARNET